jgi:hypothetical protein
MTFLERIRAAVNAPNEVQTEDEVVAFLERLSAEENSASAEVLKRHRDFAMALLVDRPVTHDELVSLARQLSTP